MEKRVGAFEAQRQFGKMMQDSIARGDKYVVEQHGEAVAAVVPIEVYEQWKRERATYFAKLRGLAEQSTLASDEADALAAEAIEAIRATA